MFHHTSHTLHDKLIGYPENFIEPPLGYYVREQLSLQVAKADPHRFTLYRSDFLPGTDRFSPSGSLAVQPDVLPDHRRRPTR